MNSVRASLTAGLAVSLAAVLGLGIWASQLLKERNAREAELQESRQLAAAAETAHASAITALEGRHRNAIDTMSADFEARLESLEKRQAQRLTQAYNQFSILVGESDEALAYIAALEKRLREGQLDASLETERLGALAGALSIIADSYSEPMAEFAAVAESFAQQANTGAGVEAPDPRFRTLKRLFSRGYREDEQAYREDLVRREAFESAHAQIKAAYDRAQKKMDGMAETLRSQATALYAMADKKKLTENDLEQFFKTSRRVLHTHQEMLDFEPDLPEPAGTKP